MPDKISTIAIVTCNRLPGLVRALESYIANVKKYERQVDFGIFDDSRDAQGRERTRTELRSLQAKHAVTIRYAGREEKEAFAAALQKESGVDRKIIDFALFDPFQCGNSVGANRNAVLLHSAGELIYSADDDTVCEFYSMANYRPDLAVTSMANPTELYFFRDQKVANAAAIRSEKNLLQMVEDLLGLSPAQCVANSKLPADTTLSKPEWSQDVLSEQWRVRIGWVGIFGDSGFMYPGFLLWLSGESRRRLLKDADTYAAIKQSRQILRAPLKRTIGPGPYCQTTALGIDNRALLPPFMPVLRGEDILFGTMIHHSFQGSCFGYLPWAIRHEPMTLRVNEPDDIFIPASSVNLYSVLADWITNVQLNPEDTDEGRLMQLGKELASIGGQAGFDRILAEKAHASASRAVEGLDRMLANYKAVPDYWAKDVQRYKADLEKASLREDFKTPGDLRKNIEPIKLCADLICNLGKLLEAWPQLIKAARSIRSSNPLAQEIR
jgi:hypothetical protein